jgi:serine/threonine protein kinase
VDEVDDFSEEATEVEGQGKGVSLQHFELIKVLGRGSFGKVMLVMHKENRSLYAMKTVRKDFVEKRAMRK